MAAPEHPIVLFDGVCNLCNGTVTFLIDRDRRGVLRFASLQSPRAAELLRERGRTLPPGDPDTMLLVDGDRVHDRSTAALRIARHLGFPWSLAIVLFLVPRLLRDAVYRVIARNRYRWFGRSEQCRVPTPELRARFLT
jgi:predicted DCC family thiol-disulfide oxidoreductase YuxK